MQWGVAVVFGQALVLVAFTGKLDTGVFGQRDAQRLPMQLLATQVAHSCKPNRWRTLLKFLPFLNKVGCYLCITMWTSTPHHWVEITSIWKYILTLLVVITYPDNLIVKLLAWKNSCICYRNWVHWAGGYLAEPAYCQTSEPEHSPSCWRESSLSSRRHKHLNTVINTRLNSCYTGSRKHKDLHTKLHLFNATESCGWNQPECSLPSH